MNTEKILESGVKCGEKIGFSKAIDLVSNIRQDIINNDEFRLSEKLLLNHAITRVLHELNLEYQSMKVCRLAGDRITRKI